MLVLKLILKCQLRYLRIQQLKIVKKTDNYKVLFCTRNIEEEVQYHLHIFFILLCITF